MAFVAVLTQVALWLLAGASTAHADAPDFLTQLCGDGRCATPCTGSEGPGGAASCISAPGANASGPVIARDCYEHAVFGGECAACNVTDSCPDWCPEVRSAGCRPYEVICGYVETVEFAGPRDDLVTRGPLFCRKVECGELAAGAGAGAAGDDVCWFAVDGHEVCCVDGVPTYVTGSGRAVPGFRTATAPEAALGPAVAPGEVESSSAAGRRGLVGPLVAALAGGVLHACVVGVHVV